MIEVNNELLDVYIKMFDFSEKTNRLFIDFYQKEIKFIENRIKMHIQQEPFKILKKNHIVWEKQLDELQLKLFNSYNNLGEEIGYRMELLKSINYK